MSHSGHPDFFFSLAENNMNVWQLTPLVEMLGNSSLDATRGRHVLRTVFGRGKNLTTDNIMKYKLSSTSYNICEFINKYKTPCFSKQVRSSHMLSELWGHTTAVVFIESLTCPVAAVGTLCIRGTYQWKWQSEPWFLGYCVSCNNIECYSWRVILSVAVTLAWDDPYIFKCQCLVNFGNGFVTWYAVTNGCFIFGAAVHKRVVGSGNSAGYANFPTCSGKHRMKAF